MDPMGCISAGEICCWTDGLVCIHDKAGYIYIYICANYIPKLTSRHTLAPFLILSLSLIYIYT